MKKLSRHDPPPKTNTNEPKDKRTKETSLFDDVDISEKGSVMPALAKILQADSIRIRDYWIGLAGMSDANYILRKNGRDFIGDASISYDGPQGKKNNTAKINAPESAAKKFLEILSNAPLIEKPYKPRIIVTDDYPETTIELEVQNDKFVFWSKSQGEGQIPWAVKFGDKEYVSNSDSPALALKELDPYLKQE